MQNLINQINDFSVKLKKGIKLRELSSRELIHGFKGIGEEEYQSLITCKDYDTFTIKVIKISYSFYALNLTLKKELVSVSQVDKVIYAVNEGVYSKSSIKNAMSLDDKEYKTFIKELCKAVNVHRLEQKAEEEARDGLESMLDNGMTKEGIKAMLSLL